MFFVNWKSNYIQKLLIRLYFSILHLNKGSLALLNVANLHFCISTWSTSWKVYLFCINMFKSSAFPHIWHPLVLISTLVILSCVRNAFPSRGVECEVFHRGHFGDAWLWTIITIFETTNNLSASWPLCVSKRQHFTIRQEPPTRSMLSPTWTLYFCWTKISFVLPVLIPPQRWTRTERWRQAAWNEFRVQTDLPANLPWDSRRCSVPCHNLLRSLEKTGLSWFP